MKRFTCILFLALVCARSSAQAIFADGTVPEITFTETRYMPGWSADSLRSKTIDWFFEKQWNDYSNFRANPNIYNNGWHLFRVIRKNLSGRNNIFAEYNTTTLCLNFTVEYRNNAYTAKVYHIAVDWNPNMGYLYGENGKLYPDLYTRQQLKKADRILEYVSDVADEMFRELYEYLTNLN